MNLHQDFKMMNQVLKEQQWMFDFLHTVRFLSIIYFHYLSSINIWRCNKGTLAYTSVYMYL